MGLARIQKLCSIEWILVHSTGNTFKMYSNNFSAIILEIDSKINSFTEQSNCRCLRKRNIIYRAVTLEITTKGNSTYGSHLHRESRKLAKSMLSY